MRFLWFPLLMAVIAMTIIPFQKWLDERFSKAVSIIISFLLFMILGFIGHWCLHRLGIPHD